MSKVAVLVGSLRKGSINRKLAVALEKLHTELDFHLCELGDVPMFNQDLEAEPPASVLRLRQEIADADGVLFVTPEYNRNVPAVLSNAVDWVSRPYGKNGWSGKPGSIVGTSQGPIGTAVAQSHLRTVMANLEVRLMTRPEIYLQFKEGLIDDDGKITNEGTEKFLTGWAETFNTWVWTHSK
jgi:chromate reductase